MTEMLLPNVGRLAIGHLLGDPDVAELVDAEVVTDLNAARLPAIRVTQFPGRMISGRTVYWLAETLLQVDCFWSGGSDRFNAHRLALVAHRSLAAMSGQVSVTIGGHTETAVVQSVECFGVADVESDLWTPPKPYSRFDVKVSAHPDPLAEPTGS